MIGSSLLSRNGKLLTVYGASATTQPYGYIAATKLNDPQNRHFFREMLIETGGVADGDVVYDGTTYFLTVHQTEKAMYGENQFQECMLLICNATVTVTRLVNGAWSDVSTGVHCSIIKSRLVTPDDDAQIRDGSRGKQQVSYVYVAARADVQKGDYLNDGTRNMKVLNDLSPFVVGGVVEAQVVVE